MRLTPSQQDAVDWRGASLLLSASAGSGKTEVLARRCAALIADPEHPCNVDRLLVVTFTRAAAAELRVRTARMLRERAEETHDAKLRDHLHRQQVLIDAADIGTIDAWCGRIVRAHAAQANIDAEFSVLGEEDAHLLRRRLLDELFEWVYSADDELAEAARGWLRQHTRPNADFLRDLVTLLNRFRENLVEVDLWFGEQRRHCAQDEQTLRTDARQVLSAALAAECAFLHEQLGEVEQDGLNSKLLDCLRESREELAGWQRRLEPAQGGSADALTKVVAEIAGLKLRKPRGLSDSDGALFEEIRTRWIKGRLQKRWSLADVENMLSTAPAAAGLLSTLLDLEQRYQDMLTAAKRSRAECEFGDVLRAALDLLGEPTPAGPRQPTEIAQRLRRRYEHILVDEYQDTSPIQVEILRLVTRDEPGCSNRFMVGDVKQSIYGFRQAEPRLFSRLVQEYEQSRAEGAIRYLSDNFRSHRGLLDGLNCLFAMLFDPDLGGTAFAKEERLSAGRTEVANHTLDDYPRIQLRIFEDTEHQRPDEDDDESVVPGRLEREALAAAREIRRMLAAGIEIPERQSDDSIVLRPLKLSDIVILLRSARQNAATVAAVLRDSGIPCLTSGRDALFDVPEVLDVRNVLALLVNRRQDVPLAAYLRSPMVGLSAEELLRVRAAAPDGDYYDAVERFCQPPCESNSSQQEDRLTARVREALEQLERWSVAAREEELPELLRQILHDTALPLFAAGLPGGEHRVALLRAIENFAASYSGTGQHGVAEFVAYLDDLATAELDLGLPVALGEQAVSIMTIHAAKGREFPVVFVLNAGAKFNRQRGMDALQCDADEGPGLSFLDYPARASLVSARHELIRRRAMARDVEEELRLLYVATTRARERLLIFGHASSKRWEAIRAQHAGASQPPPLAARLAASSMLEWVMMAVAAGGMNAGSGQTPTVSVITDEDSHGNEPQSGPGQPPAAAAWNADDEEWLHRGEALLRTPVDTSLASVPAVLSVSAAKELAARQRMEDVPRAVDGGTAPLPVPPFARDAEPVGRDIGTACHHFLEHADMARLETQAAARQQLDALTAAGRMPPEEATLVPIDDVVWLAQSPIGRLIAEHGESARRELAFVYALPIGRTGETTMVRGVIDCLLHTDAGLVIVDYKTDTIADEEALRRRVADYTVQLQLYAQAAGAIFDRPVSRATLAFLRARRLVDVSCKEVDVERLLAASVDHPPP